MRLWIRLPFLVAVLPVEVSATCPAETVATFFHHVLAEPSPFGPPVPRSLPPSPALAALLETIDRATREILRQCAGRFEVFRGGAILSPCGGGHLILGRSGSGKTSRIAALIDEGFTYLGDEFLFLSRDFEHVFTFPVALLIRQQGSMLIKVPQCPRPELPVDAVTRVEILRPPEGPQPHSAAAELFSLRARHSGGPLPFSLCCDRLAPLAKWAASTRGGSGLGPSFPPEGPQ